MGSLSNSLIALTVLVTTPVAFPEPAGSISFNRDIRPILSDTCFQCHGPDNATRKADLRLDKEQDATATRDGHAAIVRGNPSGSELIHRITHADPDERMPPTESGRVLTPDKISLLNRWIQEGAKWQAHWSFIPPQRPDLPNVDRQDWRSNPIDRFILHRLEKEGLQPSPPASKTALLRRVTFDLTGLPPSLEEIDGFLADNSPGAYEKVVDRLLATARYAERMTTEWLDAARYADSHGYSLDRRRVMWPWRDWVLHAYDDNLPFDEFATLQLAGDLLPNATVSQQIATGFNRNHPIQSEGGVINEEYRVETVVDRVETTSAVFLGLTLGCARCHDHKYEPITQKEFYSFFAFFNNVPESAHVGNSDKQADKPFITAPSVRTKNQLTDLKREIANLEKQVAKVNDKAGCANSELSPAQTRLAKIKASEAEIMKSAPTVMVMAELNPPRKTFVLNRGQYDQPTTIETNPGLPSALGKLPDGLPANRLALARWITSPANPLTARVTVNRYWQMYFGNGIVKSAEDFGAQGEWPTHPDLLDWLATEFVRSNWNVKEMQKLIVTSATYRQSAKATPSLLEQDPNNRLLARGPRFRLPAEMIRDHALSTSGLLVEKQGGESVRPYQPPGLWDDVVYSNVPRFEQDHGDKLYRRSLYTYWKRSVPPPSMQAFDAPSREACVLTRSRSNTPLAALVLMNDPTFVEAARKLAERIVRDGGKSDRTRLHYAFRLVTARPPRPHELELLSESLSAFLEHYRDNEDAASALMKIGESPHDDSLNVTEVAAYTAIANALLSSDESITK
jgi:hypothetical protein